MRCLVTLRGLVCDNGASEKGGQKKVFEEIIIDNFQYLERDITLQILKAE